MPLKFTKDQIKRYLREMGYDDLSDEHLDLFIKDLKKLIRHEDKKRHARRTQFQDGTIDSLSESSAITSNTPPPTNTYVDGVGLSGRLVDPTSTSTSYKSPPKSAKRLQQPLPPPPVTAPAAKSPKTTPRISLVPGKSPPCRPSSVPTAVATTARIIPPESMQRQRPDPLEEFDSDSSSLDTSSSSSSLSSGVDTHLSRATEPSKYTGRMDPVARYHYYKNLWDKQKAPGEDRHMQLRWNVRAGTMGKVPCDPLGIRVKYLR